MERDTLTHEVIRCSIEVHRFLGPGLLESTYQACLAHELELENIPFRREAPMSVQYKGTHLDCPYRIDFIIRDRLILELKAVESVLGIHRAQMICYMRLSAVKTGLLINFNVPRLVDGLERFRM